MSPRGRAVLLAFALVAPGCFLHKPPPKPAPCAKASTEREVFLGLYSIFYRVTAAVSGTHASGWVPAKLADATRWLHCDPDDARRLGRIRYAVVKLAAGIVSLPSASLERRALERALHDLIGETTLLRRLARWAAFTLPTLEDVAGEIIDESKNEPGLTKLQRTCCPCIEDCVAGPSTGEAITEFLIKVNRSPPCLFHAIDPQCWPSAVPLYATETFILANAPCVGGAPMCRTTDPCVLGPPPIPHPTPPSAGTPWCGLVYEDVKAESNGVTATFKNVLKVDMRHVPPGSTPATATGITMQYGLCESIGWEMCDLDPPNPPTCQSGECPIVRDCGFARVDETGVPGWALVDGTKRIRFKTGLPHDANLWAPIALEVLVKETALAACSEATDCPRAAPPTSCTSAGRSEECKCPRDHCVQQHFVAPLKESLFCP